MILIRPLTAADSLDALTALLHAAYASLAAQGWNFTAVDQSMEVTRERVSAGQAWVAEREGRLVGTVAISGPKPADGNYLRDPVPDCYTQPGHAILAQLAVHPDVRGLGLAEQLMDAAETWAAAQGYTHVALDTAEPAVALQRRYARRGYAPVGDVQWAGKTYRSVLMLKPLTAD
ncbi:GNAT family N-acetyltransferase [Roseateles asaccharophilus]|uniref:GNAT superfamily N-acetyltransferase n=1 Tax=Roseateles asaccharophilus TaxID=582607 RepID=A0ABU2A6M8_9BURK|nr:GNAT family N-acetyltransferase [Roseateles asaccharophilus]MDR7332660.1 GNAT superfamily N-acetyltransferase [Roseateles asaccharophilus]